MSPEGARPDLRFRFDARVGSTRPPRRVTARPLVPADALGLKFGSGWLMRNAVMPAATASTGCTSGSPLRTGSTAARAGRPGSCSTKFSRPARCGRVGVPWSRSITGAVIIITVFRSSCPVTGRPARRSRISVGDVRDRWDRQRDCAGEGRRRRPERAGAWRVHGATGARGRCAGRAVRSWPSAFRGLALARRAGDVRVIDTPAATHIHYRVRR